MLVQVRMMEFPGLYKLRFCPCKNWLSVKLLEFYHPYFKQSNDTKLKSVSKAIYTEKYSWAS